MKKVLSLIVLAVSLFFANPAQAQIKLGGGQITRQDSSLVRW